MIGGAAVFDVREAERVLTAYAALMKKSCSEVRKECVKRFVRQMLKNTPPLTGGGKRKDHTEFLRRRILEMRLPRGRLTKALRARHMTKTEARAYYRKAVAMQGALISGWNAAAAFSGVKTAAWISRHGEKYGTARDRTRADGGGETQITFLDDSGSSGRTNLRRLAEAAAERVVRGFRGNAEALLKRALKQKR